MCFEVADFLCSIFPASKMHLTITHFNQITTALHKCIDSVAIAYLIWNSWRLYIRAQKYRNIIKCKIKQKTISISNNICEMNKLRKNFCVFVLIG